MFIDPEPKPLRQTHRSNTASSIKSAKSTISNKTQRSAASRAPRGGDAGSGSSSSQKRRDGSRTDQQRPMRKVLHERTPSQNNAQQAGRPSTSATERSVGVVQDANEVRLSKPMIRLVGETPEPEIGEFARVDDSVDSIGREKEWAARNYLSSSTLFGGKFAGHTASGEPANISADQAVVKPASVSEPGFSAYSPERAGASVSALHGPTNHEPASDYALRNASKSNAQHAESFLRLDLPSLSLTDNGDSHGAAAPHRRDNSNSTFLSDVTTLLGNDSLLLGSGAGTVTSRLSQGTTLRGTRTPWDQERRDRADAEELGTRPASIIFPPLEPLPEGSPERQTVWLVPSSEKSLPSIPPDSRPDTGASDSLPPSEPPSIPPKDDEAPLIPRKSSRRDSESPVPQPLTVRKVSASSPAPRPPTGQSLVQSPAPSKGLPSSPNLISYSPTDSDRPRSASQPLLRSETSIASLNSILQYPAARAASQNLRLSSSIESFASVVARSQKTLAKSESRNTLRSVSSRDTLPPLRVPKKRLRHKAHSQSLRSAASSSRGDGTMDDDEFDTEPYPRHQFSSYLSTIASESERSDSRHLSSHFSLGSGVLTGDDASRYSMPMSGEWSRRRASSVPLENPEQDSSPVDVSSSIATPHTGTSTSDEPGDMTLGVFRAESAKPDPLRPKQSNVLGESRRYDGPLPPLPPEPNNRDSDEGFDTISELSSAPALKAKKSGYSLRRRSNSTPSHSRQLSQVSCVTESEGGSVASLFPTWAWHFYSGTAQLVSASKISLSSASTPRECSPAQAGHARNSSQWTERSITSRLGTGYTHIYDETPSPTSSHFLPSIFRPRTRARAQTDASNSRSRSRVRQSSKLRISTTDSRPDSLAIQQDPMPRSRFERSTSPQQDSQDEDQETLPSGQPRWGSLRDSSASPSNGHDRSQPATSRHKPVRQYSRQRHWDELSFPRPMTKDRLSELHGDLGNTSSRTLHLPHLTYTRRNGARSIAGLSNWQAPSFVESLDTFIKSRGNRQILLFACGFVCPLLWMLGAVLPLPERRESPSDGRALEEGIGAGEKEPSADSGRRSGGADVPRESGVGRVSAAGNEDDVAIAMMKSEDSTASAAAAANNAYAVNTTPAAQWTGEDDDDSAKWLDERTIAKARWWRTLNRVMAVVGLGVLAAVIALAVVATT